MNRLTLAILLHLSLGLAAGCTLLFNPDNIKPDEGTTDAATDGGRIDAGPADGGLDGSVSDAGEDGGRPDDGGPEVLTPCFEHLVVYPGEAVTLQPSFPSPDGTARLVDWQISGTCNALTACTVNGRCGAACTFCALDPVPGDPPCSAFAKLRQGLGQSALVQIEVRPPPGPAISGRVTNPPSGIHAIYVTAFQDADSRQPMAGTIARPDDGTFTLLLPAETDPTASFSVEAWVDQSVPETGVYVPAIDSHASRDCTSQSGCSLTLAAPAPRTIQVFDKPKIGFGDSSAPGVALVLWDPATDSDGQAAAQEYKATLGNVGAGGVCGTSGGPTKVTRPGQRRVAVFEGLDSVNYPKPCFVVDAVPIGGVPGASGQTDQIPPGASTASVTGTVGLEMDAPLSSWLYVVAQAPEAGILTFTRIRPVDRRPQFTIKLPLPAGKDTWVELNAALDLTGNGLLDRDDPVSFDQPHRVILSLRPDPSSVPLQEPLVLAQMPFIPGASTTTEPFRADATKTGWALAFSASSLSDPIRHVRVLPVGGAGVYASPLDLGLAGSNPRGIFEGSIGQRNPASSSTAALFTVRLGVGVTCGAVVEVKPGFTAPPECKPPSCSSSGGSATCTFDWNAPGPNTVVAYSLSVRNPADPAKPIVERRDIPPLPARLSVPELPVTSTLVWSLEAKDADRDVARCNGAPFTTP